jgi:uncharacterized Ntn-hydrolase superfamily protein
MATKRYLVGVILAALLAVAASGAEAERPDGPVATFSIVARDPAAGEWGVGVASRFFAVGAVVPWAKAGVGAVATQSFMNTTFGPRGLDLLAAGLSPEETLRVLLRTDDNPTRRQVGVVAADGASATYTGADCIPWAGGRHGDNYAVQGNILTGEAVVASMEKAYLETKGTLADRIYAALLAGDAEGGDARGRQSAAILVVRAGAGYGGYTDRAIDIRVDDHPDPFGELGRLLRFGQMNYCWNDAWTLFTKGRAAEALPPMEKAAGLAPDNPEVCYDLAVIRLAAGRKAEALEALRRAVSLNPKLKAQARGDKDLAPLAGDPAFEAILK